MPENRIIIYPAYFDSNRSRKEGRKVSKKEAVSSPTIEELMNAVRELGLKWELQDERAHPSTPWKKEGRILIADDEPKTRVLKRIATLLKSYRS